MNFLLTRKSLLLMLAGGLSIAALAVTVVIQNAQLQYLRQRVDTVERQAAWFQKETRSQISLLASQPLPEPVPQQTVDTVVKLADAEAHAEAERNAIARKFQQAQVREQQMRAELNRVKAATSDVHAQIAAVSSQVGSVKTELASTDSKIDKSMADLKRVMGDMGVQSATIATNRRELEALKARGDRNYFDFEIARGGTAKRVSDVYVTLKKSDPKRNRYTIEVLSNDRRIEKKDRSLNEPIQFYVAKPHGQYEKIENDLYEIVVNEVKKDTIVGYLTTPKYLASASTGRD